jgi:hypothetical protein
VHGGLVQREARLEQANTKKEGHMIFRYNVVIVTDTQEQADRVMVERIGNWSEDYGFVYTIDYGRQWLPIIRSQDEGEK